MERIALLTGAAGGLGRAMAAGLVAHGYATVLVDRDEAALDALAADLTKAHPGARVRALAWDLADPSGVAALGTAAEAAFGPVDFLVNNAGLGLNHIRNDFVQKPIMFWEVDQPAVERFFAVNGLTPFLLAGRFARGMIERRFGRIVNVTTSLDSMIRRGFAPYGGTKASLEAHSAIMAADLEGTGVTVNVLIPGGPADTPMMPAETGYSRAAMISPDALVPPLLWLLSDEAAAVTNRRVLATLWKTDAEPRARLDDASAPTAWAQMGSQTVWPT